MSGKIRSSVIAVPVGAVMAVLALTLGAAGPAAAKNDNTHAPSSSVQTAVVTVSGMVDSSREVTQSTAPASETFTVTGAADQLDALVAAKVSDVGARLSRTSLATARAGVVTPMAFTQVGGTCGWSWVELRATGSYVQGQGYLRAGWQLTSSYARSAGAYVSDVLLYSNSIFDGWTAHFSHSGTMDGLTWEKDTRVTIPSTQNYGAHMIVGTVSIIRASDGQPSSCSTVGPRVDNVKLYH
jgi:hypothetical protein